MSKNLFKRISAAFLAGALLLTTFTDSFTYSTSNADSKSAVDECEHDLVYGANGDGTHQATCKVCDLTEEQDCVYENNVCTYCGYENMDAQDSLPEVYSLNDLELEAIDDTYAVNVKGSLPGDTELLVTSYDVEGYSQLINDSLTDSSDMLVRPIRAYGVDLMLGDAYFNPSHYDSIVTLSFEGFQPSNENVTGYRLDYYDNDGNMVNVNTFNVDDKIWCDTDTLYVYVVSEVESAIYESQKDGTHLRKATVDDEGNIESCDFNEDGFCVKCGAFRADCLTYQTLEVEFNDRLFTAEGKMPFDAELVVNPVNTVNVSDVLYDNTDETTSTYVYEAYDICVMVDGVEYQPGDSDEVLKISIKNIDVESAPGEDLQIFHIDDHENVEVLANSVVDENEGTTEFETDSFSTFVIAGVTFSDSSYGTGKYYRRVSVGNSSGDYGDLSWGGQGGDNNIYAYYYYNNGTDKKDGVTLALKGSGPMAALGEYAIQYEEFCIFEDILSLSYWDEATDVSVDVPCDVYIDDNITNIGAGAFRRCHQLRNIYIGSGVTTIERSAFDDCIGLSQITGGENVTTLCKEDDYAFSPGPFYTESYYYDNIAVIRLADTVSDTLKNYNWATDHRTAVCGSTIGSWPVGNNSGSYSSANPSTDTCDSNITATLELVDADDSSAGYKLTLDGAGTMAGWAGSTTPWSSYRKDIVSVDIADGITNIGAHSFDGLENLTEVTIPSSVYTLEAESFANCPSLTTINGGANVSTVATQTDKYDEWGDWDGYTYGAFYLAGYSSKKVMTEIDQYASEALKNHDFTSDNRIVKAADGSIATFNVGNMSLNYTNIDDNTIVPDSNVKCKVFLNDDNKTYTIKFTGTGLMAGWKYSSYVPWYSYMPKCTTWIFEEGITDLGANAVYTTSSLSNTYEFPTTMTIFNSNNFKTLTKTTALDFKGSVIRSTSDPSGLTFGKTFYDTTVADNLYNTVDGFVTSEFTVGLLKALMVEYRDDDGVTVLHREYIDNYGDAAEYTESGVVWATEPRGFTKASLDNITESKIVYKGGNIGDLKLKFYLIGDGEKITGRRVFIADSDYGDYRDRAVLTLDESDIEPGAYETTVEEFQAYVDGRRIHNLDANFGVFVDNNTLNADFYSFHYKERTRKTSTTWNSWGDLKHLNFENVNFGHNSAFMSFTSSNFYAVDLMSGAFDANSTDCPYLIYRSSGSLFYPDDETGSVEFNILALNESTATYEYMIPIHPLNIYNENHQLMDVVYQTAVQGTIGKNNVAYPGEAVDASGYHSEIFEGYYNFTGSYNDMLGNESINPGYTDSKYRYNQRIYNGSSKVMKMLYHDCLATHNSNPQYLRDALATLNDPHEYSFVASELLPKYAGVYVESPGYDIGNKSGGVRYGSADSTTPINMTLYRDYKALHLVNTGAESGPDSIDLYYGLFYDLNGTHKSLPATSVTSRDVTTGYDPVDYNYVSFVSGSTNPDTVYKYADGTGHLTRGTTVLYTTGLSGTSYYTRTSNVRYASNDTKVESGYANRSNLGKSGDTHNGSSNNQPTTSYLIHSTGYVDRYSADGLTISGVDGYEQEDTHYTHPYDISDNYFADFYHNSSKLPHKSGYRLAGYATSGGEKVLEIIYDKNDQPKMIRPVWDSSMGFKQQAEINGTWSSLSTYYKDETDSYMYYMAPSADNVNAITGDLLLADSDTTLYAVWEESDIIAIYNIGSSDGSYDNLGVKAEGDSSVKAILRYIDRSNPSEGYRLEIVQGDTTNELGQKYSNISIAPNGGLRTAGWSSSNYQPWRDYNTTLIKELVFAPNIDLEVIGKNAFSYMFKIETVTIPNAVSEIKTCAFHTCMDLVEILGGHNVTTLPTITTEVNAMLYGVFRLPEYTPTIFDDNFSDAMKAYNWHADNRKADTIDDEDIINICFKDLLRTGDAQHLYWTQKTPLDIKYKDYKKMTLAEVNALYPSSYDSLRHGNGYYILSFVKDGEPYTPCYTPDGDVEWGVNYNAIYSLKITLNDNGGTGGSGQYYINSATKTTYSDEECTTALAKVKVPTKEDDPIFLGYFTEATGGTKVIDNKGNIMAAAKAYTEPTTLYAHYDDSAAKITLDPNTGSGGTRKFFDYENQSYTTYSHVEPIYQILVPRKLGATFDGYYTAKEGGTQMIDEDGNISSAAMQFTEDTTLYARWLPYVVVKVKLDKNSGVGGTSYYYIVDGNIYADRYKNTPLDIIEAPTKANAYFLGYFMTKDGDVNDSEIIEQDGTFTEAASAFEEDTVIYARWSIVPRFKISLKNRHNSGTAYYWVSEGNAFTDRSLTVVLNQLALPTYTGHIFTGYYATSDCSGTPVIDEFGEGFDATKYYTAATSLYAGWEECPYARVKLNPCGGTGGTRQYFDYENKAYDTRLLANEIDAVTVPTRTGFTFLGFFTSKVGGDEIIDESGNLTAAAKAYDVETELYAHWSDAEYALVKLNKNGGVGGTNKYYTYENIAYSTKYLQDSITTVIVPTKANSTFLGYFTAAEGGAQVIDEDGNILSAGSAFTEDVELFAHWLDGVVIKVTLKKNGGTGGTSYYYLLDGKAYSTKSCVTEITSIVAPGKLGNCFIGYYSTPQEDESGDELIGQDLVISDEAKAFTEDTEIYAWWSPVPKYKITLKNRYNTGTAYYWVSEGNAYKDSMLTQPLNILELPFRDGYDFVGYYTEPNGGGTLVIDELCNGFEATKSFTEATTLYADWDEDACIRVRLNHRGGNNTMHYYYLWNGDAYDSRSHENKITAVTKPVRDGFTFLGYSTDLAGENMVIDEDGNILAAGKAFDKETTVYAQWTAGDVYTVTLNKNGGTGGTTRIYIRNHKAYSTKSCYGEITSIVTPTKNVNTFIGYYTTTSGGDLMIDEEGIIETLCKDITSDTTIYANWVPGIVAKVTLNKAGGSGGTSYYYTHESKAYTSKSCTTELAKVVVPTKANATFLGYYTEAEGGSEVIDENGDFTDAAKAYTEDTTLYAHWQAGNVKKVTLNKAGGSGGTSYYYVKDGVAYTSKYCAVEITDVVIPTKGSSLFFGYYTALDGGTQVIDEDGNILTAGKSFTEDTTLYAHWQTGFTVTLNKNGGTGGSARYYVMNNNAYAVKACVEPITEIVKPTKVNATFLGYFTEAEGGTQVIDDDGNILASGKSFTENTTLYAHWANGTVYKVTLNKSGGVGGTSAYYLKDSKAYGAKTSSEEINSITKPTKLNATFLGYYDKAPLTPGAVEVIDEDGNILAAGKAFATDITVYAWYADVNIAKITLNNRYSTGTPYYFVANSKAYTTKGLQAELDPLVLPTRAGYEFTGYYSTSDCTGDPVIDPFGYGFDATKSYTDNITLYAGWEAVSGSRVKLDKNGGTGGTTYYYTKDDKAYDTRLLTNEINTVVIPTKVGYSFLGYFTEKTGGVAVIDEEGNILDAGKAYDAETILYAHWVSPESHLITLNKNGGTGGTSKYYVSDGKAYSTRYLSSELTSIVPPTRSGYTFDGYFTESTGGTKVIDKDGNIVVDSSTITSPTTYYAHWTLIPATYTVTFKNWDDSVIETQTYTAGDTIVKPANPTRASDELYNYTFKSWTPVVPDTCTKTATYKAVYTRTGIKQYTVKFVNWDNSVISSELLGYGDEITVPADPTRPNDENYSYTFKSWSPAVTATCTKTVTFKALYTPTSLKPYTVKFVNWDNSVISEEHYAAGETIVVPADPTRESTDLYDYTFNYWSPSVPETCSKTATYKAYYKQTSKHSYKVKFLDYDNSVISEKTYEYGDTIELPEAPTRVDSEYYKYTFKNWSPSVPEKCIKSANYKAIYSQTSKHSYTVKFVDWDNSVISTATYGYGDAIVKPADPVRPENDNYSYTFKYWAPSVPDMCTKTATYKAYYTQTAKRTFTVKFLNYDNSVISTTVYEPGETIVKPATPTKPSTEFYNYTFNGWTPVVPETCEKTASYKATYTQSSIKQYTVKFVDYDGSVISEQLLGKDDIVTVPANPVRPDDDEHSYTFKGWSPTVATTCTKSVTYTAQYTQSAVKPYTVTFKDYDGSVILTKSYAYGDKIDVPENPSRADDDNYTYTFKAWSPLVQTTCTKTATYKATYTQSAIKQYTVKFVNWDGSVISKETYGYDDPIVVPSETPSRPDSNGYTYTFKAWSPVVPETCTKTATYKATFTSKSTKTYTIKFVDWDNSVISTATYAYGDTVKVPAEPTRPDDDTYSYTFKSWSPTVASIVKGSTTYKATYSKTTLPTDPKTVTYTVKFINWNGDLISEKTYAKGDTIDVPATPSRESDEMYTYTFKGWSPSVPSTCTKTATYTAQYTKVAVKDPNTKSFTVTFKNWDGTVIDAKTYESGEYITIPADPTREGDGKYSYTFKGWSPAVQSVCTKTATYKATFTKVAASGDDDDTKTYTVVFKDYNGDEISNNQYKKGDTIEIPSDPLREDDSRYSYEFKCWSPAVKEICAGKATYTARYTKTVLPKDPKDPTDPKDPIDPKDPTDEEIIEEIEEEPHSHTVTDINEWEEVIITKADDDNDPASIIAKERQKAVVQTVAGVIVTGVVGLGLILGGIYGHLWLFLLNLLFIKKRKKFHGILTDEETRLVKIKTPEADDEIYLVVQDEIELAEKKHETLMMLLEHLKGSGCITILPYGAKMTITTYGVDGLEMSDIMDADEDKLYRLLSEYEGKGMKAVVNIFVAKADFDIELTYNL